MESQKLDSMKEDIKQKNIALIKAAVKNTLEALCRVEKEINELQNIRKILKHDIFDLKDGRLDRILERQTINEGICAKYSSIKVSRIDEPANVSKSPWYIEYEVEIKDGDETIKIRLTNSLVKMHASGTYKLADSSIRYI